MKKTLPERYYLDHFHEFLAFFDGASSSLLTPEAGGFISAFRALDENKQCIIARAANRKYAVIKRQHFDYDEIDSPQLQIDQLQEEGWFTTIEAANKQDIAGVLTKSDLLEYLACFQPGRSLANCKKAELVALLFEQVNIEGWPESLPVQDYLVCTFNEQLRYLLFLYFGNTNGRLNQFSMRDLGIMRTRADASGGQARFETADDAVAASFYATNLDALPYLDAEGVVQAAKTPLPLVDSVTAQQFQEKYLFKLGLLLLEIDRPLALSTLQQAPGDNAKEKWLREAYKDGEKEAVKSQLEAIIDNPPSDTLLAFAEDFLARKFHKKRTSAVTDMLRNASRTLLLDESQNHAVERGVIAYYHRHNIQAWRTENRLWRSLFGLTFWTLLFDQDALVTEFDRRPLALKNNNFYAKFEADIEKLLTSCHSSEALLTHITTMAAAHYGKVNSLFMWSNALLDPIVALLNYGNLAAVQEILRMMAKDFSSLSDGFPDLMVYEKGQLRFEEIKAPGDQLRRNQLVSVQRLQQVGFDVQITQVQWFRDPMQPYVVVDIETTGGNASYNRITEVGMVKVINGEVVDTWQSLINPQRRIPASITRLTGISDAMVADAPIFAEVAEAIMSFTDDAVFVAHNVNFDYGFIKQEFARLEQPFRRPKLCTVREMRKAKPGLASYSLASLTHHFNIKMQQHHRALSDAKAAASLLAIVQSSQA
ncbi:DNA polymerase III subunit epsilon [Alteromonas pelagimontana]|uniref:DNA-directed DNA polymerase n=1 Tax=Alteromonas pelagimontana TaxID=1858656 RepID=A0A6M4MCI4_9ALTE|nr:3'-5' exonuclease [Alteromonas pelagimontana]QJR80779.1 DNA polymerase III subunit epsilon [Alteromonas pelagimontana]